MIESVEFKNFKSLKDTTLPLSRFTLLIGPNGSGKSTALQALRAVRYPTNVSYHDIVTAGLTSQDEETVTILVNWMSPNDKIQTFSQWSSARVGAGPRYQGSYTDKTLYALDQMLAKIRVFSFDAKAITTSTTLHPQMELMDNGSDLAGVLDRLRDEEPERFEALNQEVGRLLPEFDRILFDTPARGQRAFLLRTREGHHKIPARDLSEGTLLALALLTLAYLPNPPKIICIEEPDRGIHPRLLRDVKDALYRLAYPESVGETRQPVQVIATTHSPYLLDLYKEHPEEIVIANKVGQEVKFERLSDKPHYEEIIQDASLGDVWYTGILGGVPAHP